MSRDPEDRDAGSALANFAVAAGAVVVTAGAADLADEQREPGRADREQPEPSVE